MPRLPVVFGQPSMPSSSSSACTLCAARAHVFEVDAGLRVEIDAQLVGVVGIVGAWSATRGSRDNRGSRPTRCARGRRSTSARDVVPFGVLTIVVSSHSGALSGTRFWKNDEPSAPFGKRSMSTGRPPIARISGASTDA